MNLLSKRTPAADASCSMGFRPPEPAVAADTTGSAAEAEAATALSVSALALSIPVALGADVWAADNGSMLDVEVEPPETVWVAKVADDPGAEEEPVGAEGALTLPHAMRRS